MQLYREASIDLSDRDEDQLLLHYLLHGRHEARIKSYQELDAELKSSLIQCEESEVKLKLLERQFDLAKQQLETMKDLFARLADRPQLHQQVKEG